MDAEPTFAHCVLTAMERRGLIHHCVQQNHDGLPQKSGFPQEKINEIHGAWFDPSNPVVKFGGNLRNDLFEWMSQVEDKIDLCLSLGTSMSGMTADKVASIPAQKSRRKPRTALGTIIINLQKTPLDSQSLIRIWAKIDDVFKLVAKELELGEIKALRAPIYQGDVYEVPYNDQGLLDHTVRMIWDLREGADVFIAYPKASNYGVKGKVDKKRGEHYSIYFVEEIVIGQGTIKENVLRLLGNWWVESAINGTVPYLPVININPKLCS